MRRHQILSLMLLLGSSVGLLYDSIVADRIGFADADILQSVVQVVATNEDNLHVYHAFRTENTFYVTVTEISVAETQSERDGNSKLLTAISEKTVVASDAMVVLDPDSLIVAGMLAASSGSPRI